MQDTRKYTNFDIDEISEYLVEFKKCVSQGNYEVSINDRRKKNQEFIYQYKINSDKEIEIFSSLTYEDFCYAVDNNNPRFPEEILYIFKKRYKLDDWGDYKEVDIYIKINMIKKGSENFSYVVSLHEPERPLQYLFDKK